MYSKSLVLLGLPDPINFRPRILTDTDTAIVQQKKLIEKSMEFTPGRKEC